MDHAHHYNMAARALDEVVRLDECVQAAMKLTSPSNTLLVVTADHSHTITFGGASVPRGNPVLGSFSSNIRLFPDSPTRRSTCIVSGAPLTPPCTT